MQSKSWPNGMRISQVRIARPTDKLDEVVRFYRDGLGLSILGSFEGHAGYSGVLIGLPDGECHLEFTAHEDGSPGPAPSRDNLLVLYFQDDEERFRLGTKLERLGYAPVAPENPYWEDKSVIFEDPDGWRVVLCQSMDGGRWTASHFEHRAHRV